MRTIAQLRTTFDDKILRLLPGHQAMQLRLRSLKAQGAQIGDNVFIGTGVRVMGPGNLVIEDHVVITRDVVLDARGKLTIRRHALIGFESIILSHTHRSTFVGVPIQDQGMYDAPVEIGERSWMGTRTIILPGVQMPADTIIGSGAVVTKSITERGIYAGVPARFINRRS